MTRSQGPKSQPRRSRVRRSRAAWQQSIEDWKDSGLSQAAFCERHDLALSTFQLWRRRLAEEGHEELHGFVEVRVASEPAALDPGDIAELTFPSGLRLCVPRGWSQCDLVELLRALAEVGSC